MFILLPYNCQLPIFPPNVKLKLILYVIVTNRDYQFSPYRNIILQKIRFPNIMGQMVNEKQRNRFRLLPVGISQRDSLIGTGIYPDCSGTKGARIRLRFVPKCRFIGFIDKKSRLTLLSANLFSMLQQKSYFTILFNVS